VWGIISDTITDEAGMLSSKVEGELGLFIILTERTFANRETALRDEMQRTEDMTVLKMHVGEMARGYLIDRAMQPKLHLCICPCYDAPYMHEPP
jgi:hypothetical protein